MYEENVRLKELSEEEDDLEVIEVDEYKNSLESMKTITIIHIEVIEWVSNAFLFLYQKTYRVILNYYQSSLIELP